LRSKLYLALRDPGIYKSRGDTFYLYVAVFSNVCRAVAQRFVLAF